MKQGKRKSIAKIFHRWGGLVLSLFLVGFSLSGILLNHRRLIASWDLPRGLLPRSYHVDGWTQGAAVGSVALGRDSVLLYGGEGIWLTQDRGQHFIPFMEGLPKGADRRLMRRMVYNTRRGAFALSQDALYQLEGERWNKVDLPLDETLTDLALQGDSLVVMGRSHLFITQLPYQQFSVLTLPASPDLPEHRTTLFRTLWALHSGEMFHLVGRLFVDALGVVLLLLSLSGVLMFFLPRYMKRLQRRSTEQYRTRVKRRVARLQKRLKRYDRLHRVLGYWLFIPLFLLVLTGMFLRPPLLVAVAKPKVPTCPGTALHSDNPWDDALRRMVYSPWKQAWILSTREGVFRCSRLGLPMEKIEKTPPISVMGAHVFQLEKGKPDVLLVGSFMGLFRWDLSTGEVTDLYTGGAPEPVGFMPFGEHKVAGYAGDLGSARGIAFEYDVPCREIAQPEEMGKGRISLFYAMLELHTGRLYVFLGPLGILWIFLSGSMMLWLLISGWQRLRKRAKRKA